MRAILIVALLAAPLAGRTYDDRACGFRFEIPAGYEIAPREPFIDQQCAVVLRPVGKKRGDPQLDVDAVIVATTSAPFERAAFDANFVDIEGRWFMLARGPAPRATVVRTKEWRGLRGSSDLGCYGKRATLEERCIAHRAALQRTDGGPVLILKSYAPGAKALDAIVRTFEFTGREDR